MVMTCGVYWEDKKAGSGMGKVLESNTEHRDAQEGEAETALSGGSVLGFGGDAITTAGLPPIEGEAKASVAAACALTWEERGAERNPIWAALMVASKEGGVDCRRPAGKGGPWRRS